MKRLISILILFVFLFSTIGVIASSYQCKKPMTVNKSCCKASDNGCCEKNSKLLKITDHFISASFQLPVKSSLSFLNALVIVSTGALPHFAGVQVATKPGHAPPESPVDILLLTHLFRI
ncbi:MAG: hypothetical protein IPG01_02035 [Chitinophagaceae bacterium]|nr:hypothetical protein [Chitinophagaceae bacterium]